MESQGSVVTIDFEPVYHSLNALERAVRAFADVADDWCEEDAKQALVQLLSENLSQQFTAHQRTVYGSLNVAEPSKPHAA